MLAIIGCGNPNRLDDGAGVYVAQQLIQRLKDSPNQEIRIFDAGTSGMDVMFQARGCDELIIIDANQSNSAPGTIFEVPGEELENTPEPSYNLHDFRWDNALYAGRKIYHDEFPKEVSVFLIEAKSIDYGLGLTQPVQDASGRVIELVIGKINQYLKTNEPNKII